MPNKIYLPDKKCKQCEGTFSRESCKSISDYREKKYCSVTCARLFNTGENHWYWKGGIKTRPDGYLRDSKTDKYIHRIVMETGFTDEDPDHVGFNELIVDPKTCIDRMCHT